MLRYWYDQKCVKCSSCHFFEPSWGAIGGCSCCGYRFHEEQGTAPDCDDHMTEAQWRASQNGRQNIRTIGNR